MICTITSYTFARYSVICIICGDPNVFIKRGSLILAVLYISASLSIHISKGISMTTQIYIYQQKSITPEMISSRMWNFPISKVNICRILVVHTHNSRNLSCVCTTRVLHMFTQPDLLIVNHGNSYSDYVCVMCFCEHVAMFVIVAGAAIWVYATNYLTKRAQEGWNTGPVREDFWKMGML